MTAAERQQKTNLLLRVAGCLCVTVAVAALVVIGISHLRQQERLSRDKMWQEYRQNEFLSVKRGNSRPYVMDSKLLPMLANDDDCIRVVTHLDFASTDMDASDAASVSKLVAVANGLRMPAVGSPVSTKVRQSPIYRPFPGGWISLDRRHQTSYRRGETPVPGGHCGLRGSRSDPAISRPGRRDSAGSLLRARVSQWCLLTAMSGLFAGSGRHFGRLARRVCTCPYPFNLTRNSPGGWKSVHASSALILANSRRPPLTISCLGRMTISVVRRDLCWRRTVNSIGDFADAIPDAR